MNIFKTVLTILAINLSSLTFSQGVQQKPNVIFILTDDQGYGDLACHGNPWIQTPNIDKLYSQSVRFSNFHVGTTCAPSRAGLLSGEYSNKVGVWHTINGREILTSKAKTLPETLHDQGYTTGIFGKWHLGDSYPYRPQERGFDYTLVHKGGGVGQTPDYWANKYFDDTYFRNGKPEKFEGYCTDIWFAEATRFIEVNKNHPFFCYIATNAPHSPFNVSDKYSDQYKGNSNIPDPNFYGMISNIDENIGKLREKLDDLNLSENTIFIFMTDNGTAGGVKFDKNGDVISGYNAGMRGVKASPYDGGHRVPFFLYWPAGGISNGIDISKITSYVDFMPTILDLCGVNKLPGTVSDGISLKPLIQGKESGWPDRTIFSDVQREEFLVKWKDFTVMTDRWRLVGKDELYEIGNDPGQKRNVAMEHPDVVKELREAYENWWDDVARSKDEYESAIVGTKKIKSLELNSHDFHTQNGFPAWNQIMVRQGTGVNGFWAVEFARSGKYEFELRRWPVESKLKLGDVAPVGDDVPGGKPYPEGKSLVIKQARIKIGDNEQSKEVNQNDESIKFVAKIKAGKTFIQTWLKDQDGVERGAYYLVIKKK